MPLNGFQSFTSRNETYDGDFLIAHEGISSINFKEKIYYLFNLLSALYVDWGIA
jgi:hypothetical protein